MSHLFEKAFGEVANLPPSDQDAVAALIIAELASEKRWTSSFAKSQNTLAVLEEEALAEYASGKTKPL